MSFICMVIKNHFSQETFCTWLRYNAEACGILEMAYYTQAFHSTYRFVVSNVSTFLRRSKFSLAQFSTLYKKENREYTFISLFVIKVVG